MLKSVHTARHKLFCESLKRARKAAGITQHELADRLGEHQSFVSRYETGERRLDVIEYLEVARTIGIDAAGHLRAFTRSLTAASAEAGKEKRGR